MGLPEQEQKIFEQLQAQLADDPRFATRPAAEERRPSQPPQTAGFSQRRILLGVMLFAAGVVALILGISQYLLLGVLGFALMVAGPIIATTKVKHEHTGAAGAKNPGAKNASGQRKNSSFIDKLERRWDERH